MVMVMRSFHCVMTSHSLTCYYLEQAQKEACEDAKKTGEVPLADVIMMHAMKLVEMAADDKHLHEVTLSLFI